MSKKLRVLILNYEYPPLGGGAGNAVKYMLREFAKKNIEIDLVTSSTSGFKVEEVSPGIKIHFLDIGKKGSWHYQTDKDLLIYSWKAYWYSKKLLKKSKFDLVHAFFGIPCGYIAMKLGLPYIVSLRGSDVPFYNKRFELLDKLVFQRLSRKIWNKAFRVISLSDDLIELARKTDRHLPIEVIYNGIDLEEFSPDAKLLSKEKTFNILSVGRLIERKGMIYILQAVKDIVKKHPQVLLHIAGDGPLLSSHKEYVKENKLSKNVVFHGRVDHDEVNLLYKKSHVFVLASLSEALSNVTHEAIASGLPVITTKTGAAELITEGNGYVIKKNSSADIVKKVMKLVEDRKLRDKMGEKSRMLAEKMSWKVCTDKYLEIYEDGKRI